MLRTVSSRIAIFMSCLFIWYYSASCFCGTLIRACRQYQHQESCVKGESALDSTLLIIFEILGLIIFVIVGIGRKVTNCFFCHIASFINIGCTNYRFCCSNISVAVNKFLWNISYCNVFHSMEQIFLPRTDSWYQKSEVQSI